MSPVDLSDEVPFQLGDWLVDPAAYALSQGDERRRLTPLLMTLLRELCAHAGQAMTRERLMDSLWDRGNGSDEALSQAMAELRRTLGDDARSPRYIETVPRVGYRLISKPSEPPSPEALDSPPPAVSGNRSRRPLVYAFVAVFAALAGASGVAWYFLDREQPVTANVQPPQRSQVTSDFGRETAASFSPDGQRLAYAAWNSALGNWELFVRPLDGSSEAVRLTETPGDEISPSFSADGRHLAYLGYEAADCGVFRMPATGGTPERLAECVKGVYSSLDWSPDGQWIAFTASHQSSGGRGIQVISPDGGESRWLTNPEDFAASDFMPRFSPAGDQIAFVRHAADTRQASLYMADVESGEVTPVGTIRGQFFGLDWMDDGAVVLSGRRSGAWGIWSVVIAGADVRMMSRLSSGNLVASPDGRQLAVSHYGIDTNIWRWNADSRETQLLIGSTQWDGQPDLSTDGEKLAFISDRSGSPQVWVSDSDGGDARQLTFEEPGEVSEPRWSPDSDEIIFTLTRNGRTVLRSVEIDKAYPVPTLPGDPVARSGNWTQDGGALVFSCRRDSGWQICKRNLPDGDIQVLTEGGGIYPADPLGDGYVYYTRLYQNGLWRVSESGGAEEMFWGEFPMHSAASWDLVEGELYYQDFNRTMERPAVYRVRLPDGVPERLFSADIGTLVPAFSVAPGGGVLVFAQHDRLDEDILLFAL